MADVNDYSNVEYKHRVCFSTVVQMMSKYAKAKKRETELANALQPVMEARCTRCTVSVRWRFTDARYRTTDCTTQMRALLAIRIKLRAKLAKCCGKATRSMITLRGVAVIGVYS
jgi:hypothetical protein